FLVSLMRPLLVPTQIVPAAALEMDSDSIAFRFGGARRASALAPAGACSGGGVSPFAYVRSGLNLFHVTPPSVVDATYWNPATSSCGLSGENMMGCDDVVRVSVFGSAAGLTLIH